MRSLAGLFLVAVVLSACATDVDEFGANLSDENVAKIAVGTTSESDLAAILGEPDRTKDSCREYTWQSVLKQKARKLEVCLGTDGKVSSVNKRFE